MSDKEEKAVSSKSRLQPIPDGGKTALTDEELDMVNAGYGGSKWWRRRNASIPSVSIPVSTPPAAAVPSASVSRVSVSSLPFIPNGGVTGITEDGLITVDPHYADTFSIDPNFAGTVSDKIIE